MVVVLSLADPHCPNNVIPVTAHRAERTVFQWFGELNLELSGNASGGEPLQIALDVAGRTITAAGAVHLASFVRSSVVAEKIVAVKLSGFLGRGQDDQQDSFSALATLSAALRTACPNLQTTCLEFVGDRTIQAFIPLLSKPSIIHLSIRFSDLSSKAMRAIQKVLNHSIQEFEVYQNIGSDPVAFAKVVGNMIKSFKALRVFQFANCKPDEKGSQAIVNGLASLFIKDEEIEDPLHAPLSKINLEGCVLNRPLDLLIGTLKQLDALKELNLSNCNLTNSQNAKLLHKFGDRVKLSYDHEIEDDENEFDVSQRW